MTRDGPSTASRMREWRNTPAKRLLAQITFPVFYALNRPSMQWFGKLIFDFSLRCNGFAINYKGKTGLSIGEEKFLSRVLPAIQNGVLFDVGANNGSYSLVLRDLAPSSRIYAFEPHPTSFEILTSQVGHADTELINVALSDEPGKLILYDLMDHDGSTQASLSRDAVSLFSEGATEHVVTVTTLDAFIEERDIARIDVLKIDTEGFDLAVLKGARRSLAQGKIGIIHFEFIPANIMVKTRVRDFIELLPGHTLYRLCMNGELISLAPYDVKRVEVYVMHNLIALPKATASAVDGSAKAFR